MTIPPSDKLFRVFTTTLLACAAINFLAIGPILIGGVDVAAISLAGGLTEYVFPNGVGFLALALSRGNAWIALGCLALADAAVIWLLLRARHWPPRKQNVLMVAMIAAGPLLFLTAVGIGGLMFINSWLGRLLLECARPGACGPAS